MGSGGSKTANSGGKTQSVAKQETGGNKPQTETLEFYFAKPSPPSRVVWMILKALDLKFEPKLVDIARGENKLPDFLAMNPRGKVPTVKDGDFCVAESRAVATYLCNQYGATSQLYPKDPKARAKVDQVLYISEDVSSNVVAYTNLPGVLFAGQNINHDKVDEVRKALAMCEGYLSKTNFMAADHLTLADFFMLSPLLLLDLPGFSDYDAYPKTREWLDKMKRLPYFEDCNKEGLEILKAMYKEKLAALDAD